MALKAPYKTTFEIDHEIQPIFTGGSVSLDNGARILATTLEEDAVLTDLSTGKRLAWIEGDDDPISSLILTPKASHLIVCSRSLSMRIYSLTVSDDFSTVETKLLRTRKPHGTPVVAVAVDRTGSFLATGAADGSIKVWDIHGGFVTHTFRGPSILVSALHFFEVATSGSDSNGTGDKKKNKKGRQQGAVVDETNGKSDDSSQSTIGIRLASGSQDGKVRVWDLHKRSVVANLESHVSDVQAIDYSAAQNTLVTAGRDKTIIWWDVKSWKQQRVVPALELIEAAGFLDSADNDKNNSGAITYTAGANGNIRLWDTLTGRELTAEQPTLSDEESIVSALYRPEESVLLCIRLDHTLVLYPVAPVGETLASASAALLPPLKASRRICGTHDEVIDLAFLLPDQSLLALATNSEDVRIVSVADTPSSSSSDRESFYFGQDVGLLKGHDEIVVTIDVDWSGHWIATGAKDNTARLWRVDPSGEATCYAVFAGHAESVGAVALPKTIPPEDSPAFKDPLNHPPAFLVTGSQDLTIKRWDIPRQAPTSIETTKKSGNKQQQQHALFTRKAHDKDINALDVDPTGQLFASSSQDRTVKIWSSREGEVQGILRGHRRGVWSVKFAPLNTPAITGEDGAAVGSGHRGLVLTGSGDKSVRLWSLYTYTCLRVFEAHSENVLKVAWLGMTETVVPPNADTDDNGDDDVDMDEDEDGESRQVAKAANSQRGPGPVLFASADGYGLVKVWDAASLEASCTLGNHQDRVWALALRRPTAKTTRTLVSGAGDGTVTFWRDTTAATAAAAAEATKVRVEQEQKLENHMRQGMYREALELALELNHPGRLLSVLAEAGQNEEVNEALSHLTDDQLWILLLRVRDWNTNGRTYETAQNVLSVLVCAYPPSRFVALMKARKGRNVVSLLESLIAYTHRHYQRLEQMIDDTYVLDYLLLRMDALEVAYKEVKTTIDVPMVDL